MSAPLTLGIDPGKRTGWGLVADGARVVAFGELDQGRETDHLAALLQRHRPALVALEIVERVSPRELPGGGHGLTLTHALDLYRAGRRAGNLEHAAILFGVPVAPASAEAWRAALAGSARASDAAIDAALRLRLTGFPAPRKSSSHMRDGLGVALFGALRARLQVAHG